MGVFMSMKTYFHKNLLVFFFFLIFAEVAETSCMQK